MLSAHLVQQRVAACCRHAGIEYFNDYIDLFYAGWHWPTFNLADTWIFLGVVLLIGGPLLAPKRRTIGS